MKRQLVFLILTVLFAISLSGAVSAAGPGNNSTNQIQTQNSNIILPPTQLLVRTVNNRTGTQYMGNDSINKAIQDTNTISGDTLLISNGTYDGVTLNKNLTLKWDGTGTGTVVSQLNITSGGMGSTINGLNITYSSTYDASGSYGINLNGVNNVTIENCTVNDFESGAGIWMVNSNNNTIIGTRLTDNKNGIGLNSSNGNNIGVSGSTLNSITGTGATSAPASYGIYICSSANNEIYGSNIGTDAGSSQGFTYGIYFDHATGNNIIDSSNVWCNGAGIVLNWSNATITNDTEVAYNLNDGIDIYNSTAIINSYNYIDNNGRNGINVENSTVAVNNRNNIYANSGNGINSLDSTIDVENNTIGGTSASDGNGYNGIYITYTSPSTKCNTISGNGIQNNGQSGDYQGICLNNAVGNNLIQSNTISNNSYGGIYSHNSNTAIGSNTINNNSDAGIDLIYSNATVQNNTISENAFEGIEAICSNVTIKNNPSINNNNDGIFLRGSNATVQNNTISKNAGDGIDLIYSNATVQNNTILFNTLNGIYSAYSNATINNGNNIYANSQNGINSQDSTVDVENNTVGSDGASSNPTSGNGNDGILINYSTPSTNVNTIKGNKIRRNGQSGNYDGIYLNNASGNNLIQDNIISGNLYEGICLGNSNAIIQNNTINNNSDAGIELDYSNATIQGNQVYDNTNDGIYVNIDSSATIQDNNIYANDENGIESVDSTINVENNIVGSDGASSNSTSGNGCNGILINYSTPSTNINTIKGNKIRYNGKSGYGNGIYLGNATENNLIQNNTISGNEYNGIGLSYSNATIQNNTIDSTIIQNHTVIGYEYNGIYLNNSNATIQNNTVLFHKHGIYLDSSNAIIQNNTLNGNGIYLEYSNATISRGNIIYSFENGINSQDSIIDVENNTVNGYNGIYINYINPSTSVNTIKGNIIQNNNVYSMSNTTGEGIYLANDIGNNLIQNNTIYNNNFEGIHLYKSNATIQNNIISGNIGDGIHLDSSNAIIQNNTINKNSYSGIYLEYSDAVTIIQNNTISGNGFDGIYLGFSNAIINNGNNIYANSQNGIESKDNGYSNATIQNNTIGNNANYQIYFTNSNSASGIMFNNIYGNYGLFFVENNQLIQFNRIITSIEAIRNTGTGTVTATLNWFGSNSNPASKMSNNGSGVINCSSWLVLTLTADSTILKAGGISNITADLLHDSNGVYHDPDSGHIPDGIYMNFTTNLGTISAQSSIVNGIAKSILNGGSINGVAAVSSIVDSQISQVSVNVDTISPTVTVNIPAGLYNTNKSIILSINEPGTIYYTLDGSYPTTASTKYTGSITIASTTTLKFIAVDLAGNPSTVYSQTYTIDKIPPKVISTYPKRYATGVSRTKTIYLKFSENIKASSYWSKIVVKDKYGHVVSISKSISGNTLYIKTKYKRSSYSYYTVYIPKAAVKDYAGNNLAAGYTFKFKTGRY